MKENLLNMIIYMIACIAIGFFVHIESYGIATGLAMLVIVDLITGLQKEEVYR